MFSLFVKILNNDAEFKGSVTHRLLFHLGIFDCIQLSAHFASGIAIVMSVYNVDITDAPWVNKVRAKCNEVSSHVQVLGSVLEGAWVPLNAASCILASERFVQITRSHHMETLCNRKIVQVT